jgi:hypothetical protein
MKVKTTIMATAAAALLTAATIATASAQVQERTTGKTNVQTSGPNLSTGGQVKAQGRTGTSNVNAQTQFQGARTLVRTKCRVRTFAEVTFAGMTSEPAM